MENQVVEYEMAIEEAYHTFDAPDWEFQYGGIWYDFIHRQKSTAGEWDGQYTLVRNSNPFAGIVPPVRVAPDTPVVIRRTLYGHVERELELATDALRALCDSDTIEAWCADNGIQLDSVQQIRYHRLVEHIARTVLARMDDGEAEA